MTLCFRFALRKASSCETFSLPGTMVYVISRDRGVFWDAAEAVADLCWAEETATLTRNGFRRPARISAATASCSLCFSISDQHCHANRSDNSMEANSANCSCRSRGQAVWRAIMRMNLTQKSA